MLKVPAVLFLQLLFSSVVMAQASIKGKVVDETSQEPIAGASVFISNTSKGTVSDRNGEFELADIPTGKYDLVVSSIGYQTNVFNFSTTDLPLKLQIQMRIKVRELDNVTVEPSVLEGWDRWGRTFTDNFIGRTPNAAKCQIRNYKSIRFRYYKKSNRVIAYSDEPLIVENKALGYKVSYQLEEFEIKFNEHTSMFAGYPLFEETDKTPKSKIVKARDEAYYGSMVQFMRSIYNNELAKNGYEVRRMVRTPNYEKQRVRSVYRPMRVSFGSGGSATITSGKDSNKTDSSEYYERILRQKDVIDTYGKELLTADSLVVATEGNLKAIYFTDYLYVTYKLETEDQMYLEQFHEKRRPTYQQSHIWLQIEEPIAIDKNGSYFPPQNLFTMSYWGWSEKISNMLPLDFTPNK